MKTQLMRPHPLRILVCSGSRATLSLLSNMLNGFFVTTLSSIQEVEEYLRHVNTVNLRLDFIILDEQSESRADELVHFIRTLPHLPHDDLNIVHLFTPTTDGLSGVPSLKESPSATSGILRLTKPPRQARLLHAMARMKNLPDEAPSARPTDAALNDKDLLAQRRLYGNVLIAEGQF